MALLTTFILKDDQIQCHGIRLVIPDIIKKVPSSITLNPNLRPVSTHAVLWYLLVHPAGESMR